MLIMEGLINAKSNRPSWVGFADVREQTRMLFRAGSRAEDQALSSEVPLIKISVSSICVMDGNNQGI